MSNVTPLHIQGTGFRMLLGVQTPADGLNPTTKIRSTYRSQTGRLGRKVFSTLLQPAAVTASTILIDDDDFTTGQATLLIGDYTVTAWVDFIPAALLADTTDALAVAINRLPGITATSDGVDTVTVTFYPPIGEVRFDARYGGTIQNYVLAPDTGLLQQGSPRAGPPTLG